MGMATSGLLGPSLLDGGFGIGCIILWATFSAAPIIIVQAGYKNKRG